MKHFFFLLCCLAFVGTVSATTYYCYGPDEACGGTSLQIEQQGDKIESIKYIIFQSNKNVVMQYTPAHKDNWNIVAIKVEVYSTRGKDGMEIKPTLRATYNFLNTEKGLFEKVTAKLNWTSLDWKNEAQRLMQFYRDHKKEFTKD